MKIFILAIAALIMGAATAWAEVGDPGNAEWKLIVSIFTGNIGLAIGLALMVVGVFKFFVKNDTSGGLLFAIVGVLITMLPGVYNGLRFMVCPIAESLGGSC